MPRIATRTRLVGLDTLGRDIKKGAQTERNSEQEINACAIQNVTGS